MATAPRVLALASLVLLVACDAPTVIPRDAPSDDAAAPAPAPSGNESALLAQVQAMKGRLQGQDNPVDILVAIGNLSYDARSYLEAIDWYRQALERAAPAIEARRRLLDAGVTPAAAAPEGCTPVGEVGAFAKATAHAAELAGEGERAAALACYDRALATVATAYARRGAAWSLIDQLPKAEADLEAALALAPDDPEANYVLGAVIFQSGAPADDAEKQKGLAAWKHFLQVAPDHPQAQDIRAAIAQIEGKPLPPAPAAGGAMAGGMGGGMGGGGMAMGGAEMPPTAIGLIPALSMVETRLAAGQPQAALGILDQFLAMSADHPIALSQKGRALMALGRGAEAKAPIEKAVAAERSGRTLAALAEWTETVAGKPAEAKKLYEEAAKADPLYAKAADLQQKIDALK